MNANFLQINLDDLLRGLVVAVVSAILTAILPVIQNGIPTVAQLQSIGIVGLTAGVAYLSKNLLTNSKDQMFKPEPNEKAQ